MWNTLLLSPCSMKIQARIPGTLLGYPVGSAVDWEWGNTLDCTQPTASIPSRTQQGGAFHLHLLQTSPFSAHSCLTNVFGQRSVIAQWYGEPSTESRSTATKWPTLLPPSTPPLLKECCWKVTQRPFSSERVAPSTQKHKSKAQIIFFLFLILFS